MRSRELTLMRVRRLTSGLRLFDVAERTGIGESRLSRIERREIQPSERERQRLTEFFHAPVETLLRESNQTEAP